MNDQQDNGSFTDDVVPTIEPTPAVAREFSPSPWYRPRKQHLRKHQWNHEIIEHVVKKRSKISADSVLRILGLPSTEYLDLLSMRELCEEHEMTVSYLGFNASYEGERPANLEVNIYREMQSRRMIDTSSFIHPSSLLVADSFEHIHRERSVSRGILNRFEDFDIVNLDLCGCIVGPDATRADDVLNAVATLLRRQSIRRLTPWLFFVTTFASRDEINLSACRPLIAAVKANANGSEEFRIQLKAIATADADEMMSWFATPGVELPAPGRFIRVFALAMGKWLAARLKLPTPPSLVSMLPSYCFRHENIGEPQLLSLAYLIEPSPTEGEGGIEPVPVSEGGGIMSRYEKHAIRIIKKSFELRDLDQLMSDDAARRTEAANETEELLTSCGFDPAGVKAFVARYR
jgi:hypothetical protein